MLLNSLESSLGIILTMLLDSLERRQILAVLPVGPHPCCPSDLFSPSRSRPGTRELEGLELAFLSIAVLMCLEKWFRLTDLAVDHHHRLSVVGDDNPGIRVWKDVVG